MSKLKNRLNRLSKNKKLLVICSLIVLVISLIVTVALSQQNQDIREKAANIPKKSLCPIAQACPVAKNRNLLRNCNPPEADGTPRDSFCNVAGRIEQCGNKKYCCPKAGRSWTTNMKNCL